LVIAASAESEVKGVPRREWLRLVQNPWSGNTSAFTAAAHQIRQLDSPLSGRQGYS
jgi:hypothetical protein